MADIYADSVSGDDGTGDGSSGNPYETLNKAITEASDDDTVLLVPRGTDYTFVSDSIPAGLTIKASDDVPPNTITDTYARITAGGSAPQWTLTGDFTTENIVFYNYTGGNSASMFYYGSFSGNQTITFTNTVFTEMTAILSTAGRGGIIGNGGNVSAPSQTSITMLFERCLIHNIKSGNPAGRSGLITTSGSGYIANFYESTFYNDSTGDGLQGYCKPYSSGGLTATYRNCNFLNDHADDPAFCETYSGGSQASTVNYCTYQDMNTTGATITNSTNADPEYRDKANGDFGLKTTSPSIDTGLLV